MTRIAAVVIDGPMAGRVELLPISMEVLRVPHIKEQSLKYSRGDAEPSEYEIIEYRCKKYRMQQLTRYTVTRAEAHVLTTEHEGHLMHPEILAPVSSFRQEMRPEPDFIRDFDAWFDWECYLHDAPLDWVKREKFESARTMRDLQLVFGVCS